MAFPYQRTLLLTLLSFLVLEIVAELTVDDKESWKVLVSALVVTRHITLCTDHVSSMGRIGIRYSELCVDIPPCFTVPNLKQYFLAMSGASVQKLSSVKASVEEQQSPLMRQVFAYLFPFGPGWNAGASPVVALG